MDGGKLRTHTGGRVDRGRVLNFTFDGQAYTGFQGDTLASALLANGVHLVGRSFKYHRPRGIFSAGAGETHPPGGNRRAPKNPTHWLESAGTRPVTYRTCGRGRSSCTKDCRLRARITGRASSST